MKGFTLIELLVVIAIMVGATVFLIPQFNNFSAKQDLKNTAEDLKTALKTAQNNATTGVQCSEGGRQRANSWRVVFEKDKLSSRYLTKAICADNTIETIKEHNLTGVDMKIDVTTADGVDSYGGQLDLQANSPAVVFKNISGEINFICDSRSCPPRTSKMVVTLLSASSQISVTIEKSGLIYTGNITP